jgi:hypothetical protein
MRNSITVTKPREMRGAKPTFVQWAEPGSQTFRECVRMAKQYAWPDGDKCPWCGKVMREHDPEVCE